jgi:pimeloyl-ACP methyl ester carboxylesterase
MKKILTVLSVLLLTFSLAGVAGATVLNFDDVPTGTSWVDLPAFYGGFNWGDDFEVTSLAFYKADYANSSKTFPSSPNAMYNSAWEGSVTNPGPFIVTSAAKFDFIGASFSSWAYKNAFWTVYGAPKVTIQGYSDGSLVGTYIAVLTADFQWFDVNLLGVDKLIFVQDSGKYWLMDDFTYAGGAPVPEPATMLLLGSGLIGLAGFGRKKLFKK